MREKSSSRCTYGTGPACLRLLMDGVTPRKKREKRISNKPLSETAGEGGRMDGRPLGSSPGALLRAGMQFESTATKRRPQARGKSMKPHVEEVLAI